MGLFQRTHGLLFKNLSLILFVLTWSEVIGVNITKSFYDTADFITKEIDRENIANLLRNLSARTHVGGTPGELRTAQFIADTWKNQGLDEIHLTPYEVLLSYPERDSPNYVRLHNAQDEETWKSQGRTKPLHSKEEFSNEVFPDFNAYSAPGNVKGDIVFVNFGSTEDFKRLEKDLKVDLNGRIVMAKYGKSFRANIARMAERRGAIGLILYPDPQQYAQEGPVRVYPDTTFMPGSAAPFGTAYVEDGDPLTPFYPSVESAFRIPVEESTVPKIPVMPIGYDDATIILSKMGGTVAPSDWQGALNLTYKIGPGLSTPGEYVSMEVNTRNEKATTHNVIGVLRGKEEPDRYVILGNHYDSWVFGAVDPSSGTAVMLELTRTLAEYKRQTGWHPRRTLVFCAWGSEEYGLIGSQEWTEQFGKQLSARTIAYLNLDMAIEGNFTLRTKSSPLLYDISIEVSKLVPNPDPEEVKAGRTSTFDTWIYRNPDEKKPGYPKFTGLGAGSDYKCFQHNLGIPSMEYRYTHSEEMFSESLYHTVYETFYLVNDLYDRGFHFHASISQLWGLIALYLTDAEVLPFSLDDYAAFIGDSQQSLYEKYGSLVESKNISLAFFKNASLQFSVAAEGFKNIIENLNISNPLAVRRVNDQLMMVERAFIDPRGLPGRPGYNHVVFAPSSSDNYASTAFAGLSDALDGFEDLPEEDQSQSLRTFQEHLAVCTHLLITASKVLSDDLW